MNLDDNDFSGHTAPTSKGWGYEVFDKVTLGMEVVNEIAMIPTCTRFGHEDMPVTDVVIEKVTVK
ncbi:hypothetical protein MW343_003274 [Vibrio parahaemolyticus]|nr:hypothetical protein [Vibrio parahaemolyticus]EGR2708231.1 hypothetical protein [Vibrio parahaemolyticus]EJB8407772.1 hypothetical protein [Vibrio parahaemolyticus]EJB8534071.1 hypothetical protein [Vibrio parahaemolyticus]EJX5602512.1 hypothetical protein [Vibrio parahaemolyticus]